MKMRIRKLIASFVLAAGFAQSAFAEDTGLYIGAGIGRAEHAKKAALKPPEVPLMTGGTSGSRDTSWTATLGYRVNPNIAFELGYIDLGDIEASVTDPSGGSNARARFTVSVAGVTAAMVGQFPVGKWTPYIRAGVLFSETEVDYSGRVSGAAFSGRVTDSSEAAFFGAGVTYDLGSRWAAQLDFTHLMNSGDGGSGEYHNPSIGFLWRF